MPKVSNKMYNNCDEQFIIIPATIKANKQDSDEKIMKLVKNFKSMLASSIASIMDRIITSKYSPAQNDSSDPPYPITVVLDNRSDPPLDGAHYTKIGFMWNLQHEIISPKFYGLLIKR